MPKFSNAILAAPIFATFALVGESHAQTPEWAATSYFAPGPDAAPGAPLALRLEPATTEMTVTADPADKMIRNPWAWWGLFDFLAAQDPAGTVPLFELDTTLFPGLAFDVVATAEGDLIPVQRGILRRSVADRTASFWEVIVSPGRTWVLTGGDKAGWSRAAFPISLVQSQEGEAWIGLASFDYRDGEVSPLRVQFSSMSAGGFIFWDPDFDVTAWGEIPLTAGPLASYTAPVTAAFEAERKDRLPVRPLAELGADIAAAAAAFDPKGTLAVAVLSEGVLYMNPVETPFGAHPYPQDMRVGVWSITKSLIPGMAAMRLSQKYGPDFLDTPLVGYFKEGEEFAYLDEAARARWQGVTIRHALNMMTGMGAVDYNVNWASENLNTYQWSYSYDLADQIRFYFNVGANPEVTGPGQKMAYIDQDMWIATLAMERFLQSREGPDATILKMLETEVYDAIGARHFVAGTGYTDSGTPGFPFAAWGALPTIDMLARAGALVANGGKAPDGQQLIDTSLIDAPASHDYGMTFWRIPVTVDSAAMSLPYMSGAGGQRVVALPNGMSIVILSRDDYNRTVPDDLLAAIILAASKVKPF